MIRGMGQQFRFTLPYNSQYSFNRVSDVTVVFWQDGMDAETVDTLKKTLVDDLNDFVISEYGTRLYVKLNEAESRKFKTDRKAYVQMKAHLTDGTPFGTKAREFTVYPIHEALE
jgi:hypothetical protein